MSKITEQQKKEDQKNKIITDLFNSGIIHKKVEMICQKARIAKQTLIHEDVLSTVFYYLSRKPAEKVIELAQDENQLIGCCVTIARRKGVMNHSTNKEYPGHSEATRIFFASNLTHHKFIDTTEPENEHGTASDNIFLVDEDSFNQDKPEDPWEEIKKHLTQDEFDFIDTYLRTKKKSGPERRTTTQEVNKIKQRITEIVAKHKIQL